MLLYHSTNLIQIIENNDLDLLKRIIKKDQSSVINYINDQKLLHLAIRAGYKNIVEYLLKKGANPNILDQQGNSIAHTAIIAENQELAFNILKLHDSINIYVHPLSIDLNAKNNNSDTLIHLAARNGYKGIIKLLHNYNAELNILDFHGNTAINIAVQENHQDIIIYLLSVGVNPSTPNRYGHPPLYYAIQKEQKSIELMLLKNGVNNILRPIDQNHFLLFKAIVENNHIEVMNILDNEESNINTKEIYSYTPLHFAANYGNYFIVALLLSYGANPNIQNNNGETTLHFAAMNGCVRTIECLIKSGAVIDSFDKFERTPLELAINSENTDAVKLFLQYEATIGNALRSISKYTSKELVNLLYAEHTLQKIKEDTWVVQKVGMSFISIKQEEIQRLLEFKKSEWQKTLAPYNILDRNFHKYLDALFHVKKYHDYKDEKFKHKFYDVYINAEAVNQPILSLKILSLSTVNKFFHIEELINNSMMQDVFTQCDINLLGNDSPTEEVI
ncbi:MAG: ankyrin repeat domain-containing protein [Rickettsia endosymbiont of Sceptobius lativentris]|nr:ankyrin repeat domain-containing protein [Rickettsia endosymbiont of Sceptobius lativentris]